MSRLLSSWFSGWPTNRMASTIAAGVGAVSSPPAPASSAAGARLLGRGLSRGLAHQLGEGLCQLVDRKRMRGSDLGGGIRPRYRVVIGHGRSGRFRVLRVGRHRALIAPGFGGLREAVTSCRIPLARRPAQSHRAATWAFMNVKPSGPAAVRCRTSSARSWWRRPVPGRARPKASIISQPS